jgi:hypothetical protein
VFRPVPELTAKPAVAYALGIGIARKLNDHQSDTIAGYMTRLPLLC